MNLRLIRPAPSLALIGNELNVVSDLGIPQAIEWKGVKIDAKSRPISPINFQFEISNFQSNLHVQDFMRLSGFQSSSLENRIFELGFGVEAVSAVKVIQLANARGMDVLIIDSDNIDTQLPLLDASDEVKEDIANKVNQGLEVTIHSSPLTYHSWVGSGYIALDPETSEASYLLEGRILGGITVADPYGYAWPEDIKRCLEDPEAPDPVPPEDARSITKVEETDMQGGTVGEPLELPLQVLVTDTVGPGGRPVEGARVHFIWVPRNPQQPADGQLSPDETIWVDDIVVRTNSRGIAKVYFRPYTKILDKWVMLDVGDEYLVRAGLNEVQAVLLGEDGVNIIVKDPFILLGTPGTPWELKDMYWEDDDYVIDFSNILHEPKGLVGGIQSPSALWPQVLDMYGNPIANLPIQWDTPIGGGLFLDRNLVQGDPGLPQVWDPNDPAQSAQRIKKTNEKGSAWTNFILGWEEIQEYRACPPPVDDPDNPIFGRCLLYRFGVHNPENLSSKRFFWVSWPDGLGIGITGHDYPYPVYTDIYRFDEMSHMWVPALPSYDNYSCGCPGENDPEGSICCRGHRGFFAWATDNVVLDCSSFPPQLPPEDRAFNIVPMADCVDSYARYGYFRTADSLGFQALTITPWGFCGPRIMNHSDIIYYPTSEYMQHMGWDYPTDGYWFWGCPTYEMHDLTINVDFNVCDRIRFSWVTDQVYLSAERENSVHEVTPLLNYGTVFSGDYMVRFFVENPASYPIYGKLTQITSTGKADIVYTGGVNEDGYFEITPMTNQFLQFPIIPGTEGGTLRFELYTKKTEYLMDYDWFSCCSWGEWAFTGYNPIELFDKRLPPDKPKIFAYEVNVSPLSFVDEINPSYQNTEDSDNFFLRAPLILTPSGSGWDEDWEEKKVFIRYLAEGSDFIRNPHILVYDQKENSVLRAMPIMFGDHLLEWDGKVVKECLTNPDGCDPEEECNDDPDPDLRNCVYGDQDEYVLKLAWSFIGGDVRHPRSIADTLRMVDLAWRHRPLIRMHEKDFNRPSRVEFVLNDYELTYIGLVNNVYAKKVAGINLPIEELYSPGLNTSLNYIDIKDGILKSIERDPNDPNKYNVPSVYYRSILKNNELFIQYWFFYPGSTLPLHTTHINKLNIFHEGDWEGVQVYIPNVIENVELLPLSVTASQHHYGQTLPWPDPSIHGVRGEDYIWVDGNQVKLWVAMGSHATYLNAREFNTYPGDELINGLTYEIPAKECYSSSPLRLSYYCDIILPQFGLEDHYPKGGYQLVELNQMIATWKGYWGRMSVKWHGMDFPPPSPYHKTFDSGKSVMLYPDDWHDKFIKEGQDFLKINP